MARKERYTIEHTMRGFIVMDELKSMRVRGPFDGKTGKATARSHRDQLERDAASARARKGER